MRVEFQDHEQEDRCDQCGGKLPEELLRTAESLPTAAAQFEHVIGKPDAPKRNRYKQHDPYIWIAEIRQKKCGNQRRGKDH